MSPILDQQIFNVLFALVGALGGWCFKTIWGAIKDLQLENKQFTEKVSKVEILIAGNYASKADLTNAMTQITTQLYSIENKIDKKEDRKTPH